TSPRGPSAQRPSTSWVGHSSRTPAPAIEQTPRWTALPAALQDYFPGQMDDLGPDQAAIVFLAEVDHIAVRAGIEDDLLVGQEIGVHQHFDLLQVAEGRRGAES